MLVTDGFPKASVPLPTEYRRQVNVGVREDERSLLVRSLQGVVVDLRDQERYAAIQLQAS